jgi:hypothetical protein
MATLTSTLVARPAERGLRYTHLLLGVQSLVIVLLSFNRLSTFTLGYVAPNEFLRWVDLNNMLLLPLASLVAFYLLKKHANYRTPEGGGLPSSLATSDRASGPVDSGPLSRSV